MTHVMMTDLTSVHAMFEPLLASAPPIAGGRVESAQPQTIDPGAPAGAPAQPPGSGLGLFLPMFAILGVLILVSTLTGRKEKKRREEMMRSISRHDRVQTVGGMLGTVVEVRDDEIILKVDESTGTRIHVVKSAIQGVLKQGPRSESGADAAGTK